MGHRAALTGRILFIGAALYLASLGASHSYRPGREVPGFIGAFDDLRIYDRCVRADEIGILVQRAGDIKHPYEVKK